MDEGFMVSGRVVVAVVLVVLVAGIGVLLIGMQQTPPPTNTTTATTSATTTTTQTPATTQNIVSLTLYLNDYGYNASRGGPTITAYVGDIIRIRLIGNSSGPIVHDFVLDKNSPSPYNVKSNRLSRGQEQVIEFTANIPGEFKYYCSVAPPAGLSHRERGQEGVIRILEK
ncbi:MAG: hypothetical protein QXE96_01060 [Candidatus Caldarchaeum sp.]